MKAKQMTWEEFATAYCSRQENSPTALRQILLDQILRYQSDGFMLLQCEMLDSQHLGEYTILGFGGFHTYKEIPEHPISPRGLVSSMSIVAGWITRAQVETAQTFEWTPPAAPQKRPRKRG